MTICKTEDQRKIWDRIEARIDEARCDGIAADGGHSFVVEAKQQGYIEGLRSGRLSAIRAIDPT